MCQLFQDALQVCRTQPESSMKKRERTTDRASATESVGLGRRYRKEVDGWVKHPTWSKQSVYITAIQAPDDFVTKCWECRQLSHKQPSTHFAGVQISTLFYRSHHLSTLWVFRLSQSLSQLSPKSTKHTATPFREIYLLKHSSSEYMARAMFNMSRTTQLQTCS